MCIFHKIAGIKHEVLSPGAAARVRPSSARSVLHQTNLPPIDVCTIQLVQSPLHVRVGPKLYHPLVCAFLVGIGISHFSCLTHEVLEDTENVATSFCLNRQVVQVISKPTIRVWTCTLRSCQLQRLDRFSTMRRYSVRTGGPYLSLPERLRLL